MPRASAAEVLAALAPVIDRRGVRWYVFGAQAVMVYGQPRLSDDVDVTVEVAPVDLRALVDDAVAAGFAEELPDDDEFLAVTRVVPLRHRATNIPVDMVLAGPGLEELFLDRAAPCDLGGVTVPVIAPEHLVVTKILAGRDKDRSDALSVLLRQGDTLDLGEIRSLLTDLEQALGQSDLLPVLDQLIAELE